MEQFISEEMSSTVIKTSRRSILPASVIPAEPFKERRRADYFDVIGSSLEINTPDQFRAWVKGDLQYIFPHGMLICGIGLIENKTAHIQKLLTSNTPPEYVQTLHKAGGMGSSPVFKQWIKTRRPVLFELAVQHTQTAWLENFKQHGLQNMAAHGQCDLNSNATSYFSFCKIPGRLTSKHSDLLKMLVPHLHMALIRAFQNAKNESRKPNPVLPELTEREREILQWLCSGKSNVEISQLLRISENTVKNHVQRVLLKLKVNTRAQAMAQVLNSK